jgi:hypothetical protein
MNVNSLYRLASLLDTEGKYLEADVVLDSMIRLAAGPDGRGINQGRARPRNNRNFRLTPQQIQQRLNPNAPVAPAAPQTLVPPDNLPRSDSGDYLDKRPNSVPKKPLKFKPTEPLQFYEPPAKPVAQVPKPPSSAYNPDPFGNYSIRDTLGYTDPGPVKQPTNTKAPRTQTTGTRPYNLGQMNNEVRMRVFQNPKLNPQLAATLELERSLGRFNPKTGELVESAVETLGRAFEKGGPTVVQQGGKAGRGGAAAAAAAKASQFATKAANNPATANIISALTKVSRSLSAIKPLLKILPFLGFAASIPDMIDLVNKINQKGWKSIWDDPYDRAKAIGTLANTVSAAVSLAPGPLTPVALALSAIGIGSDVGADVARDAGDAAEGGEFKLFGKTLKQKSQQRQQQDAFEAGYNAKNIDPQVQSALDASKRMFMAGSKITDIMNDPKMKSIYTWLGTGDARDTQFKVQLTVLRKSLRSGGAQPQAAQQGQPQQQGQGPYLNKPPYSGPVNQQVQPAYNNSQQRQQQMPPLNNHNDLLYKAYVDTTQTSNVTLENLKNYRQQIITKIQALAQYYPNINAQQAITALDNRIRKYSGQAQAQPA